MSEEKILITIDRKLMWEYCQYYLKENPRVKSFPLASKITEKLYNKDCTPQLTKGGNPKTKSRKRRINELSLDCMLYGSMSLNEILVIQNRMTMNGIKQKWGNFGMWLADKYNLSNKKIENSLIEVRVFGETQAKRDLDNLAAGIKFLNDGLFVKSKMYIDDNYNHINPLIIVGDYDKEHPRTEIRISVFDNDLKDIYEKNKIHIENWK